MNHSDTTQAVISHVEALASVASDEVVVPPFEHRGGPVRRPRRSGLLAAAVAAVMVAVVGAGWWLGSDDEVRTVDTTVPAPEAQGDRLVPTEWPSGLSGEISATDPADATGAPSLGAHDVLSYDGVATATVTTFDFPLGRPDAPPYEEYQLDGRAALWVDTDPGGATLGVAVAPGRTTSIASRTASRAQLEALGSAVADADGDPDSAGLPDGWSITADSAGIADLLMNGGAGPTWSTVSQLAVNSNRGLAVSTQRVDDPKAAIALAGELAGRDSEPVALPGGGDGLLINLPPINPTGISEVVLWSPNPDVIAVAVGTDIVRDELLAAAGSARSVSAAEWVSLSEPDDPTQQQIVNGFDLPASSIVVDTGDAFSVTWIITQEQFERSGEQITGTSLLIRDGQGVQGGGGGGGSSGGSVGLGYSRAGAYVTLTAEVPTGSRDVTIEALGTRHPTVQVPLPGGRTDFVFTVLPSRDTPNISGTGILRAQLPDGTTIISPPDLIPG